jgi:hypothetical protein
MVMSHASGVKPRASSSDFDDTVWNARFHGLCVLHGVDCGLRLEVSGSSLDRTFRFESSAGAKNTMQSG